MQPALQPHQLRLQCQAFGLSCRAERSTRKAVPGQLQKPSAACAAVTSRRGARANCDLNTALQELEDSEAQTAPHTPYRRMHAGASPAGSSFAVISPRRRGRVLYERSQPDDHVGPDFWGGLRVSRAQRLHWWDLVLEASSVSQQLATVVAVSTLSFLLQQVRPAGCCSAQVMCTCTLDRPAFGHCAPSHSCAGCGARLLPDRGCGGPVCTQPGPVRAAARRAARQGRPAVPAADWGRGPYGAPAPDAHAVCQQVGRLPAAEIESWWLLLAAAGVGNRTTCQLAVCVTAVSRSVRRVYPAE